jgi:hypothetical protein
MFTMVALLTPDAADVPIEALADKVRASFGRNPEFRLEFEMPPGKKTRNLMLRWRGWWVRLFCETGDKALADTREFARILGSHAPAGLAESTRRVRAVFDDDAEEEHLTAVVEIMSMLEKIDGAIVYDPQQGKLMD